MVELLDTVPWFWPALALGLVVAAGASRGLAKWLRGPRWLAFALVASTSLVLAATLTPGWAALAYGAQGPGRCDLSRLWPLSIAGYLDSAEALGNVVMLVPLGVSVALVADRRRRLALALAAALLPVVVEATQRLLPALGRSCEGADVADNLTGLVLGLVLGTIVSLAAGRVRGMRASSSATAD
jgi:hypothetical protein